MNPQRIDNASGAILAGGAARRLGGVAKGMLLKDGEPLVSRTVRVLRELFDEVLLSANDPALYGGTGLLPVPDRFMGKGAPGGLHAVLGSSKADWVFVVACDMPYLSAQRVSYLADRRKGADAVVVRFRGRLEPLHAFWSRACLAPLERLLTEGSPSLRALAGAVNTVVVEESDWTKLDPDGQAFVNINTAEDARRLGILLPE